MNLVGIPHSTIRYWDLRYFFDKRSYDSKMFNCGLPLPDYVGVNGEAAKKMYIFGGYPMERILEVEALRYQYLNEVEVLNKINDRHVLVLGGKNIKNQIKLLDASFGLLDVSVKFIIKTDPWNPIKLNDFQKLRMRLTTNTISELLGKYNIVYTDNITSAAVDAYCMGKQVISMLDPSMLNLSPLLDYDNVLFVSSSAQLAKAINSFSGSENFKREYFYLDPSLSRWEKLINKGKLS
jgi:surface carbohydrate biosynthesis protein (TIGR04326 family)